MAVEFTNVTLEAEHVPEISRTLEADHTVSEQDLPGMVNVYVVFDGARLLLTQFKAGKVFDALNAAQASSQADAQSAATAPAASGGTADTSQGSGGATPPAEQPQQV